VVRAPRAFLSALLTAVLLGGAVTEVGYAPAAEDCGE